MSTEQPSRVNPQPASCVTVSLPPKPRLRVKTGLFQLPKSAKGLQLVFFGSCCDCSKLPISAQRQVFAGCLPAALFPTMSTPPNSGPSDILSRICLSLHTSCSKPFKLLVYWRWSKTNIAASHSWFIIFIQDLQGCDSISCTNPDMQITTINLKITSRNGKITSRNENVIPTLLQDSPKPRGWGIQRWSRRLLLY